VVRVSSRIPEGQVGALFASRGKIQGLELFDSSKTFSHYLERLVSSYALSSLADRRDDKVGVTTPLLQPAQFCPHQPESCSRLCETACLRPNPGQGMAAPMGHTPAAEAASWT